MSQTLWFTPALKKVDLTAIDEVINGAEDAVLFLMFQPGASGALGTLNKLLAKNVGAKKYIKRVVSTLPEAEGESDGDKLSVKAIGDGKTRTMELDIVQPEGIKTPFASWAATLSRHDFIPNIGYAIVHSKIIVVDPFSKPVIIVGSHNFSLSASAKNDENFLIIRNQPEFAKDYAAHILSVYEHFRWLKKVNLLESENKVPGGTLFEDDKWQAPQLKAGKRELDFWVR